MALHPHTVRFSGRAWDLISKEADSDGISANAWVAEAAMARLVYNRTMRQEPAVKDWAQIQAMVNDICRP